MIRYQDEDQVILYEQQFSVLAYVTSWNDSLFRKGFETVAKRCKQMDVTVHFSKLKIHSLSGFFRYMTIGAKTFIESQGDMTNTRCDKKVTRLNLSHFWLDANRQAACSACKATS